MEINVPPHTFSKAEGKTRKWRKVKRHRDYADTHRSGRISHWYYYFCFREKSKKVKNFSKAKKIIIHFSKKKLNHDIANLKILEISAIVKIVQVGTKPMLKKVSQKKPTREKRAFKKRKMNRQKLRRKPRTRKYNDHLKRVWPNFWTKILLRYFSLEVKIL